MSSSQGIVLWHKNFQQYLNWKIQNCGFPYPRQNILAHPCFFLSYVLDEFVLYLWGQSFKLFWINIYCFGILKSFLTEIRVQVVETSVTFYWQQSFSGLHSPKRTNYTITCYSQVQTIYCKSTNVCLFMWSV